MGISCWFRIKGSECLENLKDDMRQKAVFLDRDGVLNNSIVKNGKPYPPATLAELRTSVDVLPALTQLKSEGYLLIGITNQPDVARGTTLRSMVEAINAALMHQFPLNEIRVCYHDDHDNCTCRKPLPGLLFQAANDYEIDLEQSFMIGDRWKDIEAGQQAGCKTIWLNYQYEEKQPNPPANFTTTTLLEASNWILNIK
jgi:D-glycero-D-manno-heptose 1,7-bisphosphate phosphatase